VVVPITDVKFANVWHHEITPNKANGNMNKQKSQASLAFLFIHVQN
jgi:hypothetical protein